MNVIFQALIQQLSDFLKDFGKILHPRPKHYKRVANIALDKRSVATRCDQNKNS